MNQSTNTHNVERVYEEEGAGNSWNHNKEIKK
jgi:hypothetical protein